MDKTDIEMIYDNGKVYFDAEGIIKWLESSKKIPELKILAKGLRTSVDAMKQRVKTYEKSN